MANPVLPPPQAGPATRKICQPERTLPIAGQMEMAPRASLVSAWDGMTDDIPQLLLEATALTCGTVEGLAKSAGLSPPTVWSWMGGRQNPSGQQVGQLANELEHRSQELTAIAKTLRRAAREPEFS